MLLRISACLIWFATIGAGLLSAQDRDAFVSDASHIVGTYNFENVEHSPEAMAEAGRKFLDSLDDDLRAKAVHAIDSAERQAWTNLPARPDAGGVPLGQLNADQVRAACDLMAAIFSEQGFMKMRDIMLADDQLLDGGRPRPGFGTETFAIVIFGEPSATEPWAFQLDGHHIGVNIAITGDQLTLSPSFIGTQPERFKLAGREVRPLADEIDLAYELTGSLTADQLREALINPRRGQIITGPGADFQVPDPVGLSCAQLDASQRSTLIKLISTWVNVVPSPHASARMEQLEKEIDQMHFAWYGAREPRSDISYRIQGPTLIIEFACQQMGGNPLDHLHTMYRDPTNEYGKQLPK